MPHDQINRMQAGVAAAWNYAEYYNMKNGTTEKFHCQILIIAHVP